MAAVRTFLSIPALLVALSGLAGCYDLSAPAGPRREDFMPDPGSAEADATARQQNEQAQAQRTDQAEAATKAIVTSGPPAGESESRVDGLVLNPGAELTIAEYVARYIHPAPTGD